MPQLSFKTYMYAQIWSHSEQVQNLLYPTLAFIKLHLLSQPRFGLDIPISQLRATTPNTSSPRVPYKYACHIVRAYLYINLAIGSIGSDNP